MANLHSRSSRPSPCTSASSVAFFLFSFFSFSFASLCQKEENATLSSCFFPFVFSLLHFLSLFLFCFASQKRSVLVPPHIASHFHLVSSQKKKKLFLVGLPGLYLYSNCCNKNFKAPTWLLAAWVVCPLSCLSPA